MINLLEKYSLSEILMFLAIFAVAIKEFIQFVDWAKKKIEEIGQEELIDQKQQEILDEYDEAIKNNDKRIELLENQISALSDRVNTLENNVQTLSTKLNTLDIIGNKLDILLSSDMENIKSYITEKHHYFCYQKGWIDDYSLECCENRFKYYKKEGGNSFISTLMDELRALPKRPKTEDKEY